MAFGLQIIGTHGRAQIDQDFTTMRVTQKGTASSSQIVNAPNIGNYPMVFVKIPVGHSFIGAAEFNAGANPLTQFAYECTAGWYEYAVVSHGPGLKHPGSYGMIVYKANGEVAWDSRDVSAYVHSVHTNPADEYFFTLPDSTRDWWFSFPRSPTRYLSYQAGGGGPEEVSMLWMCTLTYYNDNTIQVRHVSTGNERLPSASASEFFNPDCVILAAKIA